MRFLASSKGKKQNSVSDGLICQDKLQFLPDQPADFGELDAFGHRAYAETLFNIVASAPDAPFCVGVIGGWGTGKSGIKEELHGLLQSLRPDVRIVDFDAWQYSRDHLERSFLETTIEQLKATHAIETDKNCESFYCTVAEAEKTTWVGIGELWEYMKQHWQAVLFGFFAITAAQILVHYLDSGSLPTIPGSLTLHPGSAGAQALKSLASELTIGVIAWLFAPNVFRKEVTRTRTRHRHDSVHEYLRVFDRALAHALQGEFHRCVVLIDNLDRCPAREVEEVLSAIKTFYSDRRVIYVVFCDDAVLESRLKDSGVGNPGEYLRKFFSTSLRIAEPVDTDVVDYCSKLLRDVHLDADLHVADTIVTSFATNPRRAKQLVNRLVAYVDLAKRYELSGRLDRGAVTGNLPLLAKLLVMEEDHRIFWEYLHRDPDALFTLTRRSQVDQASATEEHEYADFHQLEWGQGEYDSLLDFLRATSWVDHTGLTEMLRLQRTERRGKVPNITGLRNDLIVGASNAFATKLLAARDGRYESEFIDACLDETTDWAGAKRWGLVHNSISLILNHYDEYSVPVQDSAAWRLNQTLSNFKADPIIFKLSPTQLMKVAAHLEGNDRRVLIDKVLRCLNATDKRDAVLQAVVAQADMLTETERQRVSEHLGLRLYEDEPSLVTLIDSIRQKGDPPATVLVEPLYAYLMCLKAPPSGSVLNPAPESSVLRLLLLAQLWKAAADGSRDAFADQVEALVPLSGADVTFTASAILLAFDALPLDLVPPAQAERFAHVLIQVSSSMGRGNQELGDRCLSLLFKLNVPLRAEGVEEIISYIAPSDIGRIHHIAALLCGPHCNSTERARIMKQLVERALQLGVDVDCVNRVFDCLASPDDREAEREALVDLIGDMLNASDYHRVTVGGQLLAKRYMDIPKARVDDLLHSVINVQSSTTGDPNWGQRNNVLVGPILQRASDATKRTVLDYFNALLTGNYPEQGKDGIISAAINLTNEQLRSEADCLSTLLNSRAPSSSHLPICDVVLQLKQLASREAIRGIETYAANTLASDDPAVEELGHHLLRSLGKVSTRPAEYLRTNLYERAAAQDGERRQRFLATLNALRTAHERVPIWDEVDALGA